MDNAEAKGREKQQNGIREPQKVIGNPGLGSLIPYEDCLDSPVIIERMVEQMEENVLLCNQPLYKYVRRSWVENFLFGCKKLCFSNPITDWEDQKEAFLFHCIKNGNDREITDRISEFTNDVDGSLCDIVSIVEDTRCLSWSTKCDDSVMWKAYNYYNLNETLMIATTREKLCRCGCYFVTVDYSLDENNIEMEAEKVISDKGISVAKLIGVKEKKYEFESEVRTYIQKNNNPISIENASELIDYIMIPPYATEAFRNYVVQTYILNGKMKIRESEC